MGWSCRSVCLSSLFSQEALGSAGREELAAAKNTHSRLDERRHRGNPISRQELVLVDLAALKIPRGTSHFRQRVDNLAAFPLRDPEAWHFQELAALFLHHLWSGGLAESVCFSSPFGSINGALVCSSHLFQLIVCDLAAFPFLRLQDTKAWPSEELVAS